ncbi:hypothetical protein PsyrCH409_10230 [Pseudomonas viridiflava]|nr:hypothetical protein AO390_18385 [Pseudomonas marginalis ICMP 11289]PCK92227.1 hypothetical protein PsyrCH409_10230 [Pseudomonas viridiflava]
MALEFYKTADREGVTEVDLKPPLANLVNESFKNEHESDGGLATPPLSGKAALRSNDMRTGKTEGALIRFDAAIRADSPIILNSSTKA